MKHRISYDSRHPWGPFLSWIFLLLSLIAAFGALVFFFSIFKGGEMILLGFIGFLLCGGLAILFFMIPIWIENSVISNSPPTPINRDPLFEKYLSKLTNTSNSTSSINQAPLSGKENDYEEREIQELILTQDDITMLRFQFRQMIQGVKKYSINFRSRKITMFEFDKLSPKYMGALLYLFLIPKNPDDDKTIIYVALESSMGSPMLCVWNFDDNNRNIGHFNYGICPIDKIKWGDLLAIIFQKLDIDR